MTHIGIQTTDEFKEQLQEIATRERRSLSQMVRLILEAYVEEQWAIEKGLTQINTEALR